MGEDTSSSKPHTQIRSEIEQMIYPAKLADQYPDDQVLDYFIHLNHTEEQRRDNPALSA
jgi:hypothetical protein